MRVGDRVRRKQLPDSWGVLKRGHMFFGMPAEVEATVVDIEGERVYLNGYADWPHSIMTLEVVNEED